jgi:type IV pilus assembly protein PilC
MMVLVALVFAAMLIFVIPTFKQIYGDLGGSMPALTAGMMAMSDFVISNMLYLPFGFVALFFGIKKGKKQPKFISFKDRIILKLPIFGKLFVSSIAARMAATLSSSLGSGVQLLEALRLSSDVAANEVFSKALMQVRTDIRDGSSFGDAISKHPVMPQMFTSMVRVGEETGALETLITRYAAILEDEVSTTVDGLTSIMEPLLISVFGSTVGIMVVALYLPLINIFKFLK